ALFANASSRDVNPVARNQLFILRQVDGGHCVLVAVAAATAGMGDDAEDASQQPLCSPNVTGEQQLANAAARNHVTADLKLAIDLHLEPASLSKLGQFLDVALRLATKVEIGSLMDFCGLDAAPKNLFGEVTW